MPEEKFFKDLLKLFKKYPGRIITAAITIVIAIWGVSWATYNAIYDDKTYLIESVEEENKKLKEELEQKTIDIQEVQELYGEGIIIQTELEEGQIVPILNGGVIIKAYSVDSEHVTYEFSFNGKSVLPSDERWKDGSNIKRVPFEYKDKTYFIVTKNIVDDKVNFSVYLSE